MKKIKYLLLCLMFIPFMNVLATNEVKENEIKQIEKFNVVAGENITTSDNVNGSSVVAGNIVTAENIVKGIDAVFGENVTYKGNSDYTLIAGNTVNVSGVTNNDALILGNSIIFDKDYKASRDLFVFGSTITLKGEITRDVKLYSSSVILDNVKISGDVTIYAANIDVKNITVNGKFSYNNDAQITIDDSSVINSKETYEYEQVQISTVDFILNNIVDYVGILIVFAVLALIMPSIFNKIEKQTEDISISKFISMIGYGLFFLIIVPIIFVLLLFMTVTIPLSLLLLTIYIIVICLSTIFTGYFIGLIVWKKFIKKDINMLLVGLVGITIVKILTLIPYVTVIITLISLLLSLSIFSKLFTKDA